VNRALIEMVEQAERGAKQRADAARRALDPSGDPAHKAAVPAHLSVDSDGDLWTGEKTYQKTH